MSALVPVTGMPQPPVSIDLTTTNQTTVLDNDTDRLWTIVGLIISNDSGSAVTCRIELEGSHVWFDEVPANSPAEVPVPIYVFPGKTLQATAGGTNAILLHVNYLMSQEPMGS